jgi:hypothetical protein
MKIESYDVVSTIIFWEGTRNIEQRTFEEQEFIQNVLYKYQIKVLEEPGYGRDDKQERINHIKKNLTGRYVNTSFDDDLRVISGLDRESIKFKIKETVVMGIGTPPTPRKPRNLDKIIKRSYTHDEEGKVRTSNDREMLLRDELRNIGGELKDMKTESKTEINVQTYMDAMEGRIMNFLETSTKETANAMALQFERMNSTITGTNTQLDGLDTVEQVKATKQIQKDVEKLITLTEGGKSWNEVSFKDLPKWFKTRVVIGFKSLALSSVLLPIWTGPKAVINGTVITPLKLVGKRVNSLISIIQEIWGWTLVGFCICGVWVVYSSPEYEQERLKIFELYATSMEYLEVIPVLEPSKRTARILWEHAPGKKFFTDVVNVMSAWLLSVPGYVLGWAKDLLLFIASHIKNVMLDTVNEWWKNVKIW